jgi:hypothetical protein
MLGPFYARGGGGDRRNLMKLNFRRGFLRLWLIGSAVFAIVVISMNAPEVISLSHWARFNAEVAELRASLEQAKENDEKGRIAREYNLKLLEGVDWLSSHKNSLPPDMDFKEARKLGMYSVIYSIAKISGIAFGVPLGFLVLGVSIGWAINGFTIDRRRAE